MKGNGALDQGQTHLATQSPLSNKANSTPNLAQRIIIRGYFIRQSGAGIRRCYATACLSRLNTEALKPGGVPPPQTCRSLGRWQREHRPAQVTSARLPPLPPSLLLFPLASTPWHLGITDYLQQVLIKWPSDFIL